MNRFCVRGLGMQLNGPWPRPGPGGGGEEPPAWARAGSIADLDFVNDPPRAWTAGGGEVAFANFDTILGDSVLIPNRAYDPADVQTGVGYVNGVGSFIGDWVDAFNFDFTAVIEFDGSEFNLEYVEGTFGTDLLIDYGAPGTGTITDAGNETLSFNLVDQAGPASEGAHKIALSVSAASAYAAIDGLAMMNDDVPPASTIDPSTPNQPTDIVFTAGSLQRVTIYAIKNEADTLTLSA